MTIKRYPQISREHAKRYTRVSKADIIEAYRDLYRETHGVELDDSAYFDDLEHRIELLKANREHETTHTPLPHVDTQLIVDRITQSEDLHRKIHALTKQLHEARQSKDQMLQIRLGNDIYLAKKDLAALME